MNTNQLRLIDEFTKLVSIDSPSYGERQMGDYITKRLTALGLTVIEDDAGEQIKGNCGNIYAFLRGNADRAPQMFCAHMDTVEPSRGKQAIIGDDGVIRSGGNTVLGADDLTAVAAILEALTVIKEQNLTHGPIEVLFTVAEEVYSQGGRRFDFSKIMSEQVYVLDLTGPVGTAAYKAPSILPFKAVIRGRSSHAGFAPEKGIHAIAVAADAISMMPLGRIDEDTTVNVGIIEGGLATNTVPEKCVVRGEVRSLDHSRALKQAEAVKRQFERAAAGAHAAVDFDIQIATVAYETPIDHPIIARFERACNAIKLSASFVKTFGGSDNNIIAELGIPGIVVANAMNRCHSREEFTTTDELARIADLTLALMTID
jgi:tripeptide aminopeptidase